MTRRSNSSRTVGCWIAISSRVKFERSLTGVWARACTPTQASSNFCTSCITCASRRSWRAPKTVSKNCSSPPRSNTYWVTTTKTTSLCCQASTAEKSSTATRYSKATSASLSIPSAETTFRSSFPAKSRGRSTAV